MNGCRMTYILALVVGMLIGQFVDIPPVAQAQNPYALGFTSEGGGKPSALDLKSIVSLGGGVSIDASNYTALDLKSIVSLASKNSFVVIKNAGRLTTLDCKAISGLANGFVIFDY